MIKHIVLFKFREDLPEKEKTQKLEAIKADLEALTGKIESLKKMEAGINCNPAEAFDLALTSEFESMEGLKAYAEHPEHLKTAAVIREILDQRACVDYEL
ncbi:MAG: Dabb family protein [Marinilabilia sp.]